MLRPSSRLSVRPDPTHWSAIIWVRMLGVTTPAENDLGSQVRHLIRIGLASGRASALDVAAWLRVHPRTLQRSLAASGTSFASLLDETRRDLATNYLTHSTCVWAASRTYWAAPSRAA